MTEAFIGEIRAFPYTYTPIYWLPCDGRTISISEYQALYAVIGAAFGQPSTTTFVLPDLRGQMVVGSGAATAQTSAYTYGSYRGAVSTTLQPQNVPAHTHTISTEFVNHTIYPQAAVNTPTPGVSWPGRMIDHPSANSYSNIMAYNPNLTAANVTVMPTTPATMSPSALSPVGGNATGTATPIDNHQPYTAIKYYICHMGYFPLHT